MLQAQRSALQRLPEGMHALREVIVFGCAMLAKSWSDWLPESWSSWLPESWSNWLPVSSGANVRVVRAVASNLRRLPKGMGALERVYVDGCPRLAQDWLPTSSACHVHTLSAANSNLVHLPESASALMNVNVCGCTKLAHDWLPSLDTGYPVWTERHGALRHCPTEVDAQIHSSSPFMRVLFLSGGKCMHRTFSSAIEKVRLTSLVIQL